MGSGIERIVLNLGPKIEKFTISIFSNSPEFDFDVLNLIKSLKPKDDLKINFQTQNLKKLSKVNKINSSRVLFLQRTNGKKKT